MYSSVSKSFLVSLQTWESLDLEVLFAAYFAKGCEKMDELVNKIAALGVPGLVLVVAMAVTG